MLGAAGEGADPAGLAEGAGPDQVGPEREVEAGQARGQAEAEPGRAGRDWEERDSFLCLYLHRGGLCLGLEAEQPVQRRHRPP